MSPSPPAPPADRWGDRLPRRLGFWSAVAVLVGSTIGGGIFRTPAVIAERVVVEALERAWHAAKDFNPGAGSAFAWLSEIARSVAQGRRRPRQDPATSVSAAL